MAERIKFTDRALTALPPAPPGQRPEYVDTETDGLRLRITSSGVKTFSLLRRIRNGPMERITLGRFPDALKTEAARTQAKKLNGIIAGGANPGEVKRANMAELTFGELFMEYMERHSKPRKRTASEDQQKFRAYLERPLARKKLSRVTRADLAAVHSTITKAGHATVANRVIDLASSVFGRAVAWGYLDTNPAKGVETNPEQSRERFLKPGELPRVFAALEEEPNETFRDYFLLALLTGARRANVATMRWANVDLNENEWRIPMTKNGEPQSVPLVPEAVEILEKRKEAAKDCERFVFPATRSDSRLGHISGERKGWLRMLDRDEITQLRVRIIKAGADPEGPKAEYPTATLRRLREMAAGLRLDTEGTRLADLRIHDLRRTMGSWQARTGASMIIIGKSLGHKSQQATAVYARLDLDPVRAAMEAATTAMLEAGRQKPSAELLKFPRRA